MGVHHNMSTMKNHIWLNLLGIVAIVVTFLITITFNALSGSGSSGGIFISTVGNLSDTYELSYTPSGYVFSIWGIIYFWLASTCVFYVFSLFSGSDMGKLYLNPEIATPWYSFFFTFNLLVNVAWLFTWDREQIVGASILLFLIAMTNIMAIGILARNIAQDGHQLREDRPKIYWVYVILPLNGQGIYTTWTCIASLVNLGTALRYVANMEMEKVSHICLGSLLALIIIYFILESTILDNYIRLLLTPYLVVIWASVGILVKKLEDETVADSTKALVKAILGVACGFLVLKLVLVTIRQLKRPLGQSGMSQISVKPTV